MKNRKAGDQCISDWIKESEIKIESGMDKYSLKRVIDGKAYNVKTAVSLAIYDDPQSQRYEAVHEELFQTRSGAYFLAGAGATYSPWSYKLRDCNDYIDGHGLLPMSEKMAKEWLEIRGLTDNYDEIFGLDDEEENQNNRKECPIVLRLPCVITDRLARIADEKDCSRQQLLKNMIEDFLNEHDTRK